MSAGRLPARTRPRTLAALGVLAATLVLALASPAHADAIHDAGEAMRSWAGTARMTSRAWLRHAVPSAYAQRTFDAASSALRGRMHGLAANHLPTGDAAAMVARLDAVRELIGQLGNAVARDDGAAVAPLLDRLDTISPGPGASA
jgi:hypothetical protein